MPELSEITEQTIPLTATIHGVKIVADYRPAAFTPAFEVELRAWQQQTDEPETVLFARMVNRLIARWDLTEDGAMVPLTETRLINVPAEILAAVVGKVMEHILPNPNGTGATANGASATVPAARRTRSSSSTRGRSASVSTSGI